MMSNKGHFAFRSDGIERLLCTNEVVHEKLRTEDFADSCLVCQELYIEDSSRQEKACLQMVSEESDIPIFLEEQNLVALR